MLKIIKVVLLREIRITFKSPGFFFLALLFPLFYLLIFIPAIGIFRGDVQIAANYFVPYTMYLLPGMVLCAALVNGQYVGLSLHAEKMTGELEIFFGLPFSRTALLLGKMFNASLNTFIHSLILLGIGWLFVQYPFTAFNNFWIMIAIGIAFSWISVLFFAAVAVSMARRDHYTMLINLVTFPTIFVSSIFYPTMNLPELFKLIAKINPLTCAVDLSRNLFFVLPGKIGVELVVIILLILATFWLAKRSLQRCMQ